MKASDIMKGENREKCVSKSVDVRGTDALEKRSRAAKRPLDDGVKLEFEREKIINLHEVMRCLYVHV